jgi:3-hydroxyisobutyrate dehydrogenase-like beta-hydroxyacid dehydrogenase
MQTEGQQLEGDEMKQTIGIIGLGRCGMPAAKRFIEHGFTVYGHARRPEVVEAFTALGGRHLDCPADIARHAPVVIVMVLNDEQVIDVITGPRGILQGAPEGRTVVCMSTINRDNLDRVFAACSERRHDFIDCPFTGGPARVANGTLTLIAAAPESVLAACRPVLEVIGKITYAGERQGMGQAVKHCNQLLVTAIHAATIELIVLAQKSGVDPKLVCDVVGSGIGGNDYFRLLSKAVLDQTASPGGMGQLWKDINIVVTTMRKHNLPLLVASAVSHYFNMAVAQGLANDDSSRMMETVTRMIEK